MRFLPGTVAIASALLISPCARAQSAVDPAGHWEGSITAPMGEVFIHIDLAKNDKGVLAGTFTQPGQSLNGFPLTHVTANWKVISFAIDPGVGGGVFDGVLTDDGRMLAGNFATKAGLAPFSLTRNGEARIEKPAPSTAIGKELEGVWNGTLAVEGTEMHLVLKMSNQADGTAIGSVMNLDQGAVEIPITSISQQGIKLAVDVKIVSGSYAGTLNALGTELIGTWTQGPLALPLTFHRADSK